MATTINAYKVSLSLDAGQYISASSLSRQETSRLKKEIEGARTPAEQYTNKLNLLNKALKEGAIDLGTYNRLIAEAGRHTHKAASATDLMVKGAKAYIAVRVADIIKDVAVGSVKLAADAEDAAISFRVLLKDAKNASIVLDELRTFAAKTPFQFPEIRDAAQSLIAFGFNAHNVTKEIAMLGNIAAATGTPLGELAQIVGKAKVENTIFAETLNQMAGRGINVIDPLAKKFGVLGSEVKKLASEGKVSFTDLNWALTQLSTSFGDMTGERGKSLKGMFSTLTDEVKLLATEIADSLTPALKDNLRTMSAITSGVRSLGIGERLSVGFGAIEAMAGDIWGARGNPFSREGMSTPGNLRAFLEERFNPRLMSRAETGAAAPSWFDEKAAADALAKSNVNFGASKDIEGFLSSSINAIESMSSTVLNGLSTFQQAAESIAMVGVANTQELVKSMKEDPVVTSAIEGTQEAYEALTQAAREADRASRLEALRKQQLDENAAKQRDTMNKYLDRINTALENSGFKRIR